MKRTFYLLLSCLLFLVFSNKVLATHVAGAEITYESVGFDKYKIYVTYYRDCRGVPLSNPGSQTKLVCATGGQVNLSLTLESIEDITEVCSSIAKPCSPSNTFGTGAGREKHIYSTTVDFSVAPYNTLGSCNFIRIETGQCCRNSAITTGAANQMFYTYAEIDRSVSKTNTSVSYKYSPNCQICANQPFRGSMGGVDYIDHDSLSYEMDHPQSGWNRNISYSGTYLAYNHPFTVYYPGSLTPPYKNHKASPPIGFYFDNKTGNMHFTPTDTKEVTVFVVKTTEWKKNSSGVWKKAGTTRRS